ncbi:ATP-dependent zinc protease family protein [Halofilum ochraceum]|uniref:ATP-dependent zinc protease family protein n=1 Tax=Halofilum ochraceum TaxID=1611323 RepID=UPI00082EF296|nr:RimK/LysX family protein [Halofilum ochraceum]
MTLGGCAWTSGSQALTVDEYRTLEERWADERERRLKALLDERIEPLLEHEERLGTLERRSERILVGLRELEAAQRRANREERADDSGGDGDESNASGDDGNNGAGSGEGEGKGEDGPDLERDPNALTSGEPLIFGAKECIALPEQELVLRARIDSGANTASLAAVDIEQFERDGDPWVRFRIPRAGSGDEAASGAEDGAGEDEDVFEEVMDAVESAAEAENEEEVGVRVEAEVQRRVTIIQASGEDERPVIRLPTRIGPLERRVEYTLADRGHLTYGVLLGRRFLQDLAVIDVAREYVQPCPPR